MDVQPAMMPDLYPFSNKRNSVLFEALDLKNLMANGKSSGGGFLAQFKPSPPPAPPTQSTSDLTNQNLAVRSEGLVPNIVRSCCRHISEHGLDLVGIFRIDSSKKRIKELREAYDSGREVLLDETFNPNDAACLLKEYLRSLPEPLLTRELYSGFIAASRLTGPGLTLDKCKLTLVRDLIALLPVANRDTLELILRLLDKVRAHSQPVLAADGSTRGGNKMDAFNLAMVFGPNLLKKHKTSGSGEFASNSDKFNLIDDIDSVISITKFLIENHAGKIANTYFLIKSYFVRS